MLTADQHRKVESLERQIASHEMPREPLTAYQIFENKHFNEVKQQLPHLSKRELCVNLSARWTHKLTTAERGEFKQLAEQSQQDYYDRIEEVQVQIN